MSVRAATLGDVERIAQIQLQTWRQAYQELLGPSVLSSLDEKAVADRWGDAVSSPPEPSYHVMVATEGSEVVGFTAFGPDEDAQPDDPEPNSTAAISALFVEPRWGRRGHGARLLASVADTAAAAGVYRLVAWVPAGDTASLEFYRSAGWQPDGLQRELDTGSAAFTELRLHAQIIDE